MHGAKHAEPSLKDRIQDAFGHFPSLAIFCFAEICLNLFKILVLPSKAIPAHVGDQAIIV